MKLFPDLRPVAPPPSIDLRCCGVDELIAWCKEKGVVSRLIMADPPWDYEGNLCDASPTVRQIYKCLPYKKIVEHLDSAYQIADPSGCRFGVWYCWPVEELWRQAGQAGPQWGMRISGGAWVKMGIVDGAIAFGPGGSGVGYHWRGQTEPIAIFKRGSTGKAQGTIINTHVCAPTGHSEKPVEWLREMVRAWTQPNDLIIDLYAGRAPLARACFAEGRRYLGAEIDPDRHAQALTALARYRESL